MFPVYGLAEATLAVTFPPLGAPPAIDWVERSSAAGAGEVRALPAGDARARGIVSVGSAVLGHQVRVTGAGGQQLPSRQVGEIEVRGPAVMSAYFGRTPGDSGITGDGWLRTGDLGYLSQGRLFVTGRTKEMIVVRGVKLYPQDVEAAVRGLPGVYKRRAIAFSINGTRPERLVVLAEAADSLPSAGEAVAGTIHRVVARETGIRDLDVYVLRPRSIARTTSGKYQRLLMRERLLNGELAEALVHHV
jgi:acyl-CoA synthetase (AMP-forming)/AMP-acid ligase II